MQIFQPNLRPQHKPLFLIPVPHKLKLPHSHTLKTPLRIKHIITQGFPNI